MDAPHTEHRAGFVNIIGKPNVGKSTLLNAIIGETISITNPKAQTTRHRILGMDNGPHHQLVFSDTPGIIEPAYAMQESMMHAVDEALEDADVLLFMVEAGMKYPLDEKLQKKLEAATIPILVVINKMDASNQPVVEQTNAFWQEQFPRAEFWNISALKGFNVEPLRDRLIELIPQHPPYYDKDSITDKSERFICSEMIREHILRHYKKEIPYAVEVVIDTFKDEEDIIRISALIYVERDSQKNILIGHKGEALKKVGTGSREDMERFFKKKVFLELFVKVSKNWRKDDLQLRRFGYK